MNLPMKLLMPSPPFESIREIALKTVPSASKIEIRRALESLYGFQVRDVRTLNMEGKKKKRGSFLAAKPDYKKAYVTLSSPLSLNPGLFPVRWVQEERDRLSRAAAANKSGRSAVVEEGAGGGGRSHWLDDGGGQEKVEGRRRYPAWRMVGSKGQRGRRGGGRKTEEESKFPWSSMRRWS